MKRSLSTLVAILIAQVALSQKNEKKVLWEIAFEAGPTRDRLLFDDPAGSIEKVPLANGLFGLRLRVNPVEHLFAETGILLKEYTFGFTLKSENSYATSSNANVLLVPLCIGYDIIITKKFFLNPLAGIVPCI
jgi:hypothetical protein